MLSIFVLNKLLKNFSLTLIINSIVSLFEFIAYVRKWLLKKLLLLLLLLCIKAINSKRSHFFKFSSLSYSFLFLLMNIFSAATFSKLHILSLSLSLPLIYFHLSIHRFFLSSPNLPLMKIIIFNFLLFIFSFFHAKK